jgi:hypothetical protein
MKRLLVPVLAVLSLSACATPQPTAYQPAAGPQAMGYSEYRIEPGRYRITFRGAPGSPRSQVADLALRRAADLAIADGYDWFRITEWIDSVDAPGNGSSVSLGVGGGNFGWRGGVGAGLGTTFNLGGGPAIISTLEVLMGQGPQPPGRDVYDARGVRSSIGART